MSDSETKPEAGVPSWQLQKGPETEEKKTEDIPTAQADEPSRTELMESAKKFLEEDEVKDATTDKKIAFLESKGLKNEEIEQLIGVARNVEASNPAPKPMTKTVIPTQQSIIQAPPTTTSQAPPPQPQAAPQPYRDTPPIITYPEFLTTPQAPPPLITPARVLNTLYAFGGLGALIYSASAYIVKPMSESLVSARHELAEIAQEKLNTLNEKLKPLVSEVPQPHLAHGEAYKDKEDDSDDDEDPAEMFHRDIGVQTSDDLEITTLPDAKPLTVNVQTSKASLISNNLSEIDLGISSESHMSGQIQTEIKDLKTYLDTLMYKPPSFTYGAGIGYGAKKDEDDEIGKLKKEIRAVKGVLLSARSFPGASGAGAQFKRGAVTA